MSGLPFHPVKPVRGGKPLDGLFLRLAEDPKWVTQAKLDGQRAIWDPNQARLWSRRETPITGPSLVLEALSQITVPLDGEYVPVKGSHGRDGTYWVFDLPEHKGPLSERWEALSFLLKGLDAPGLVNLCPSNVDWAEVTPNSWEGVVFKRCCSPYVKAMRPDKTTPSWVKYRAEWL